MVIPGLDASTGADTLALLILVLVVAGLVAGLLAGLLGIGGGGVLVPVLYEVFTFLDVPADLRMHLTLGTTLAVIVPTSLKSFAGHRKRGSVDMELWQRISGWVVAGVVAGILIAKVASADALKWIWIMFASLVALKLAFGREDWRLGERLPSAPWPQATFAVFGALSTLMSIGGGTFVVPYLTLFGAPMLHAVGTAAAVGPLIAIPGVFGYAWAGWGVEGLPALTIGYVNLPAAFIIAPVSVFAAKYGVSLAHAVSRRALELAFAAFLAVVALRFLVSVLT